MKREEVSTLQERRLESARDCLVPLHAGALQSALLGHQLGISNRDKFKEADLVMQLTNAVLSRIAQISQMSGNE